MLANYYHIESHQHCFFVWVAKEKKKKKNLRFAQHSKCTIRQHPLLHCCVLRIQLTFHEHHASRIRF